MERPAAEAVHAAQAQFLAAGEALDLALRRAFWTDSRSIAHRSVILEIAAEVATGVAAEAGENGHDGTELDVAALAAALDDGRHRRDVRADHVDRLPPCGAFTPPGGCAPVPSLPW